MAVGGGFPLVVPPVEQRRKHKPQLVGHHDKSGSLGSKDIQLRAAVKSTFVQNVGGLGSCPHPQAPRVRSVY